LTKKKDFSPNDALKYFNHAYSKWAKPKLIQDQNLIKELLHIEQQLVIFYFSYLSRILSSEN